VSEVHKFSVVAGGNQSILALSEEMCERIKDVVYAYADRVPASMAIGVLHIAAKEILDEQG
jgi:hypothetical protein